MPPPGLSFPISTGRRAGGTRKAPPLPPAAPSPTDLLCLPSQSPASGPPGRSGHVQDGGLEAWGAREAFRPLRPRPGLPLPPTARPARPPAPGPCGPRCTPASPPSRGAGAPCGAHTHRPTSASFLPARRGGEGAAGRPRAGQEGRPTWRPAGLRHPPGSRDRPPQRRPQSSPRRGPP